MSKSESSNPSGKKAWRVGVLGSGVMGAGIAAHAANAGAEVVLLDIKGKDGQPANAYSQGALDRMAKQDPAPLAHKSLVKSIRAGNLTDDLNLLADCDWVIEAVIEDVAIKRDLYQRLAGVLRKDAALTSNTSSIPLARLQEGMSEDLARRFFITHFFNPPRYMPLLEVTHKANVDKDLVKRVSDFADYQMGKTIVECKDSTGFIANRLGVYWIGQAVQAAIDLGLTVEEADAVMGKLSGIPKTGVFALCDLVGLDLMPHIFASMEPSLAKDDPILIHRGDGQLMANMIKKGQTGKKSGKGFYAKDKDASGKTIKLAIDLKTGDYRPQGKPPAEVKGLSLRDLGPFLQKKGKLSDYARLVWGRTLAYAAYIAEQCAFDIASIDEAMRLGYRWKLGPFQMLDALGVDNFINGMKAVGAPVPPFLAKASGKSFYQAAKDSKPAQQLGFDGEYHPVTRPQGVIMLADIKANAKALLKNGSAALWDIGDGVCCFEFTSKMNSLDPDVMELLAKSIKLVASQYKALVIYNEGSNFSVGANLGMANFSANLAAWPMMEATVKGGQDTYMALKNSPFPVVGAPSGMALGGGCEILLHCDAVQAHLETYMGLVEVGVGLVPAWGGCKEMLGRWSEASPPKTGVLGTVSKFFANVTNTGKIAKLFETLATATVAKSAVEARDYQFLRPHDGITMNRMRLLHDAKQKALAMVAAGYQPPQPFSYRLPGPTAKLAFMMAVEGMAKIGKATPYDVVVAKSLAEVMSGGSNTDHTQELTEQDILDLERQEIMNRIHDRRTQDRIAHMLDTGRPLRN